MDQSAQLTIGQELHKDFGDELAYAEHLSFLASERFYLKNGRWPGETASADVKAEQHEVEKIVESVVGTSAGPLPDVAAESVAEV